MKDEKFVVKFIPVRNCFVHLPTNLFRIYSSQIGGLKLNHNENDFYVSHSQTRPGPNDFLSVSATFGKCLNIKEGDEIFVSLVPNPPTLTSIIVRPFDRTDWEIVNLQADKIQSIMLDQISIVTPNQAIVIWLSKYLNVTLLVESIEPSFLYGRLENHTEVHVHDAPRKTSNIPPITKMMNSLNLYGNANVDKVGCEISLNNYKRRKLNSIFRTCYMLHSELENIDENSFNIETQSPHNIFLLESQLKKLFPHQQNFRIMFGKIRKVPFKDHKNEIVNFTLQSYDEAIENEIDDVVVRILKIDDLIDEELFSKSISSMEKSVWIPKILRKHLQLQLGSKIHLESLDIREDPVTTIQIFPSSNFEENVTETFTNHIKKYSKNHTILLHSRSRIFFDDATYCCVTFFPEESKYILLDDSKLDQLKVIIKEKLKKGHVLSTNSNESLGRKINLNDFFLSMFQQILEECQTILRLSLNSYEFSYKCENILICGDIGSGKSTICKFLREQVQSPPNFIHTQMIDCKKLKGKKAEVIYKLLNSILSECAYYQPSILFFDDLESLINYSSENDENSPDTINQRKIADAIVKLLTNFQSRYLVSVVATLTKIEKLGPEIRSSRGFQLFRTVLKISSMTSTERIQFFKWILGKKLKISEDVNWKYFGEKTKTWVAQDLVDLAEKGAFIAWKRQLKSNSSNPLYLKNDDLILAMKLSKPLSLCGISLFSSKGNNWSDIGGLEEVKKMLIQLLQWPLKYPGLFSKSPVKNQSGILLYGMPGTGKTILAGAVAKECGLNFINIKGPELLSKYIGASEEAVRTIFEKAQRAKPCVLFFDEFDSFAPRRGHDSTGVTDRVVNQLLTQFDGVEGRDGVAIVAATSRPDLLDPALLRPGRLDKSILCPLPNQTERENILRTLCTAQSIDSEHLDLKNLAILTTGFTGADLNSILTQARLDSLEKVWSSSALTIDEKDFTTIKITQEELMTSLKSTQPSLTPPEMMKFDRIYTRFSKGDSGEILNSPKSTLA